MSDAAEENRAGPLARIARRGAALSAFTLVLVQGTSLIATLILARLLTPEEVGLYAAGTVLAGFLTVFAEGGLRAALIQRETDVDDAADTVFYATAVTGLGMSLLALAAAPVIAAIFRSPQAGEIAAVTSGMLLMHGFTNVPDGLMQRRFNFKRRLIIDPLRSITFGVVAIVFAAAGFGVYALVAGNYASTAVWLVGTWLLARWRPGRGRASIALWRELARFAYPLVIQNVVKNLRGSAQTALIGRGLGEGALGQYRYGRRLGELPATAVIEIGSYVLFPAFSRLAGEPERFKQAFLRALRWIWIGAAPVTVLIVLLGEAAVVILLGERWQAAGEFMVAMAGYGAGVAVQAVALEVIRGSGRSSLLNLVSAAQLVLGIGLVVALLPMGLVGVGLAASAASVVVAVLVLVLARSVIPFTARELGRRLAPPAVAALVALGVVGPLEWFVLDAGDRGIALGLAILAGEVLAFAVVYLGAMGVLDRPVVLEVMGGLRALLRRRSVPAGGDGQAENR
ncbi:MAG: lipopolysaccharide biosynthesis protein [Pseudonocardia sp.]